MKTLKKLCVFMLTAAMVLQFAGCGKDKTVTDEKGGDTSLYLTDKPVELEVFYPASKDDDGQWKTFKEAAKMTNVTAKVTMSKSMTDFNQAFNLMVVSGKMPDVVMTYDPTGFSKLAREGAFVPLNEYFDECAPNIKKFLDEHKDIKKAITSIDGNIYYIPHVPGGNVSQGWFIRQDWLDKLGLKTPTTTEELYNVLKAFKNGDPNGNGKADEVPYFGAKNLTALFILWNARTGLYIDGDTVKYGPYEPEYKEAIKNITKWYNEGLLDREILTRATDARDKMLSDNIGGVTHNWFGSTARYNDTLKDKVEGFSFVPIEPINGIELDRRPQPSEYGWGISASSKNIEVAMKWLDFWYSEAGSRLMNFGVEGKHYDMVDGKPQFKKELLEQADIQKQLTEFGVQMDIGFPQDFEYEKQWLNQIAIDGMNMYENGDYIVEQVPTLSMWIDEKDTDENAKLQTQITTYTDEMMQKWILGAEDIDATYDKFIKGLESMGIEKFLKLQQKAYDKYRK